jgi:wyosine [tRNA(Phe)-imidazoG37] synthetase (radical SAM superfamily)
MARAETPVIEGRNRTVLVRSPFLHDLESTVYSPLSGVSLERGSEANAVLSGIASGAVSNADPAVIEHLRAARFLIEDVDAETRRTRLLYLSLETCTTCNHRCPFCPVSIEPRDKDVMPQELFESIVDQAVAISGDRLVVFLSNYNEPTFDPLFDDRVRYLLERGIGVSILTNASRFTPERAALIRSLGRFLYIGVNLPTLRPERYEQLHGTRDLDRVLANMETITTDLADEIAIVLLGNEDDDHRRDTEEIRARFEPKGWKIKPFKIRSRPGSGTYVPEPPARKTLRGCDLMGSRPFEHLHVTATGKAVLCCQDYYEHLPIGDVRTQTVAEILGGDTLARLRRWVYGLEEAPADFICRRCEFSLGD